MKKMISNSRTFSRKPVLHHLTLIGLASLFSLSFGHSALGSDAVGDYKSVATGTWNTLATWNVCTVAGSPGTFGPAVHTPTSADGVITIKNGTTVNTTSSVTVDQVVVEAGGTISVGSTLNIAHGTGTDLDCFGTIIDTGGNNSFAPGASSVVVMENGSVYVNKSSSSGTVTPGAGATFTFAAGANYYHALAAGNIVTATWADGSACNITNIAAGTSGPGTMGQSFSDLVLNNSNQTATCNLSLGGTGIAVRHDLRVLSTGTGIIRLGTATALTLPIGGTLAVAAGTLQESGTSASFHTLNVNNISITGGTLDLGAATGGTTINLSNSFSVSTGATFASTSSSRTNFVNFVGPGTQNFTNAGTISSASATGATWWNVNGGAILSLGTNVISGTGSTFTNSAGGTLITAHTNGLNGNITVTGGTSFSPSGSYAYNGTAPQLSGSFLPSTVKGLTVNNNSGLNLTTSPTTVTNLNGSGTVGASVTIAATGSVSPGNSPGTLTVTNLTLDSASTNVFELTNSATAGSGVSDLVLIKGTLTPSGSTIAISNYGPTALDARDYTLYDYSATGASESGTTFNATPIWLSAITNASGTTATIFDDTGNLKVVLRVGTGCAAPATFTVGGGGSYCSGGSGLAITLSGSESGINYLLRTNGTYNGVTVSGTGSGINFNNQTAAATYTVQASNTTTACTAIMTGSASITVNASPTAFAVGGGGAYCSGGSAPAVTLAGSQSGVNYLLSTNSVYSGVTVAGTGSGITFGSQSASATYTVLASNTTTTCTATMTGSATVTANPQPGAFNVTGGGEFCSGGSGVAVGLDGSESGISYLLRTNGIFNGEIVNGTGSAISFGNQTSGGAYTVLASNTTTACTALMNGSATVTVDTAPAITLQPTNLTVCAGTPAAFYLTATGTALTYQWESSTDSGVTWSTIGSATNSSYTNVSPVSGDNGTEYHCIVSGTCPPAVTSAAPVLTVSSGVTISGQPASLTNCAGTPAIFTVSASGASLTFQWESSTDNGANWNPISGATYSSYTNSSPVTGDSGTEYHVIVTSACGSPATSSAATLTVNPLPNSYSVTGGGAYCSGGGGVAVGLSGSDSGIDYHLLTNSVDSGQLVAGNGSAIGFGNQTAGATYTVLASNTTTTCTALMSGNAIVTVNTAPSISGQPSNASTNIGGTATFTVTASGAGLSYQWQFSTDGGLTFNNVTTGTGGTTSSYTTAALAASDNGNRYQCVVNGTCSPPATSSVPTLTVFSSFRSFASGNWNSTGTWQESADGTTWVAANSTPTDANSTNILIQNGHTVTVTASVQADQLVVNPGGQITVNSGQTLTMADGPGTDLDVSGTIVNSGVLTNAATGSPTIVFESTGVYTHSQDGGTVPTATWNDGSLCQMTGLNANIPNNTPNQSFYDFTYNCTGQGANNLQFDVQTVRHTLKVLSTGTGTWRNYTTTATTRHWGSLQVSGGNLNLWASSTGTGAQITTVDGDVTVASGATLQFSGSSSVVYNMNIGGNWNNSGTVTTSTVGVTNTFAAVSAAIGGATASSFQNLTVPSGTTLTANTAPTISKIFAINGGGKYIQTTATATPGAVRAFGATSTYELQNGGVTSFSSTYGNLTINYTSGNLNASGAISNVLGNLRIQNTGSGSFRLGASTSPTVAISGDMQVDAGTFNFSTGAGTPAVSVAGNVTLNGGTLQPATSTGVPSLSVAGNWSNNGGTFTPGTMPVTFNGSGAQTIGGSAASQTFYGITLTKTAGTVLNIGGSTTALTVSGPVTNTTGILDVAGQALSADQLYGSSLITNSAAPNILTAGGNNGSSSFGGIIGGALALTKSGNGTLTLGGANTYAGNTAVNAGTLALSGSGSISASPVVQVAPSATLDATGRSDGTLTLASSQTLKGNGTVKGILAVATNSTVAAGSSVGTLTNIGPLLLQSGGTNVVEIIDATNVPGVGYDLLSVSGNLGVQATSGSPFNLKLVSFNGAGAPGSVTNFDNNTSYAWTVASVGGSVTNFDPAAFAIDSSSFSNDLAGGLFLAQTGSLKIVFTNNHPPAAADTVVARAKGSSVKIAFADLAANWSDPDADATAMTGMDLVTTNGVNLTTNDTYIFYSNTNDVTDMFTYTIHDVRSYRPGDTVRTAVGRVFITVTNATGVLTITNNTGGSLTLSFFGIPGYSYVIQRSPDLATWMDVITNTAPFNGEIQYTETPPYNPAFYRTRQP